MTSAPRSGSGVRALVAAVIAGALGFALGRFSAPSAPPSAPRSSTVERADGAADAARGEPLSGAEAPAPPRPKPAADPARTPVPRAEEPGARVEGAVVDENGRRVADALLLLGEDAVYPLADARAVGRSDAQGLLALDQRVAPPERHVVMHLFAVTPERLGWVQLAVPEGADVVHVGDVRLVSSTQAEVLVVDERRAPLAGVEVEARARFYPLAGIFDAIRDEENESGFSPHSAVVRLFRATTDEHGRARFAHLPAPSAASRYQLFASDARFGQGAIDLDAALGDAPLIRLRPPR